jgi:hypothetical protein
MWDDVRLVTRRWEDTECYLPADLKRRALDAGLKRRLSGLLQRALEHELAYLEMEPDSFRLPYVDDEEFGSGPAIAQFRGKLVYDNPVTHRKVFFTSKGQVIGYADDTQRHGDQRLTVFSDPPSQLREWLKDSGGARDRDYADVMRQLKLVPVRDDL